MTKEEILNKVKKVKALADGGVDGEREAAIRKLEKMMAEYGVTEADLNIDEIKWHGIWIDERIKQRLFSQIAKHTNKNIEVASVMKSKYNLTKQILGVKSNMMAKCTNSEWIEIAFLFGEYAKDIDKQLEIFLYAYCDKNNLLLERDGESDKETIEEKQKVLKAMMMKASIDRVQVRKQLEGGDE